MVMSAGGYIRVQWGQDTGNRQFVRAHKSTKTHEINQITHLFGGDDDLHRLSVVRACDGVVQNADGSHHLAHHAGLAGLEVRRIAHNDRRLGHLRSINFLVI